MPTRRRLTFTDRVEIPIGQKAGWSIRRIAAHNPWKIIDDPVLRARGDADLARSMTPRQVTGRLRPNTGDPTVGRMDTTPEAPGRTVSHEAVDSSMYALPVGESKRRGILLRPKRTRRRPPHRRAGAVGPDHRDAAPV